MCNMLFKSFHLSLILQLRRCWLCGTSEINFLLISFNPEVFVAYSVQLYCFLFFCDFSFHLFFGSILETIWLQVLKYRFHPIVTFQNVFLCFHLYVVCIKAWWPILYTQLWWKCGVCFGRGNLNVYQRAGENRSVWLDDYNHPYTRDQTRVTGVISQCSTSWAN